MIIPGAKLPRLIIDRVFKFIRVENLPYDCTSKKDHTNLHLNKTLISLSIQLKMRISFY